MSRIAQDLMRLIDYANAPIFGIDTLGRVNEWNRKSVEITGYQRDEVIGKNLVQDFITPDFQASVKEVLDNALQGKGTDNFEFPLYSRDGRKVEVLPKRTSNLPCPPASLLPILRISYSCLLLSPGAAQCDDARRRRVNPDRSDWGGAGHYRAQDGRARGDTLT